VEGFFETELRASSELGWLGTVILLGFARARANSSHSHPYVSLAVERGGAAGAVITAVVAGDMIWMIVCF
jgi:hypothetical protein